MMPLHYILSCCTLVLFSLCRISCRSSKAICIMFTTLREGRRDEKGKKYTLTCTVNPPHSLSSISFLPAWHHFDCREYTLPLETFDTEKERVTRDRRYREKGVTRDDKKDEIQRTVSPSESGWRDENVYSNQSRTTRDRNSALLTCMLLAYKDILSVRKESGRPRSTDNTIRQRGVDW